MSPKVLIVCLGNICRSPIGEAVLRHTAKERKIDLTVDSAGTAAYHVGEEPDDRSVYDPPTGFYPPLTDPRPCTVGPKVLSLYVKRYALFDLI
jgi:hypothetical protein